ncbi:MAG: DNA polymerase III subunit beta [Pigmentiphaga sp.]
MTVIIEAGVLARAMRSAATVVERANTIPVLSNVRLHAREGSEMMEIVTTNIDVEYRQYVALAQPGNLSTTIDAQKLAALAAAAEGAQVSLEDTGKSVIAKAGRSRWVLPTIAYTNFPELPFDNCGFKVPISGPLLSNIISRLSWSVCTEQTRYWLCGIYVDPENDKMRFTAVNGFTFASFVSDVPWPVGAPSAIIATKYTRILERLAGEHDEVELSWSDDKIRTSAGGTVLTGKLIEGTFPDYRRVIPPITESPVMVDPEGLRKALKRIEIIGLGKTRGVAIDIRAGALELQVAGTGSEEASESLPANCVAMHRAGFNAGYLAGALESVGGDTVEIHQATPSDIALIRRAVPDGAICGVMPMRV